MCTPIDVSFGIGAEDKRPVRQKRKCLITVLPRSAVIDGNAPFSCRKAAAICPLTHPGSWCASWFEAIANSMPKCRAAPSALSNFTAALPVSKALKNSVLTPHNTAVIAVFSVPPCVRRVAATKSAHDQSEPLTANQLAFCCAILSMSNWLASTPNVKLKNLLLNK